MSIWRQEFLLKEDDDDFTLNMATEEFELQKIIKVYPESEVVMIQWTDESLTIEPFSHLTNCYDSLLIRLNELYDQNKDENLKEIKIIRRLLKRMKRPK